MTPKKNNKNLDNSDYKDANKQNYNLGNSNDYYKSANKHSKGSPNSQVSNQYHNKEYYQESRRHLNHYNKNLNSSHDCDPPHSQNNDRGYYDNHYNDHINDNYNRQNNYNNPSNDHYMGNNFNNNRNNSNQDYNNHNTNYYNVENYQHRPGPPSISRPEGVYHEDGYDSGDFKHVDYDNKNKPKRSNFNKLMVTTIISLFFFSTIFVIFYMVNLTFKLKTIMNFDDKLGNRLIESVVIDGESLLDDYYENYNAPYGMKFIINYIDNTQEKLDLTKDMIISYNEDDVGPVRIIFIYKSKIGSFVINVLRKTLVSISIPEDQLNDDYYLADEFPNTILLQLNFSDNTAVRIPITPSMIEDFDPLKPGTQTVRVSFDGFSTTFDIHLVSKAISIEIKPNTFKTEYNVGDEFAGGLLLANYADGSHDEIPITLDHVTNFDTSIPGIFDLILYHRGMSLKTTITVNGSYGIFNNYLLVGFDFQDLYYKVFEYIGNPTEVVIPNLINGYSVGYIEKDIFSNIIFDIEKLTIPFIGESPDKPEKFNYFYNEDSITALYDLSTSSNEQDSENVLDKNQAIKLWNLAKISLVILNGINAIAPQTFENELLIKDISIPGSVLQIGEKAFSNSSIQSFTMPSSIAKIDDFAFENMRYLKYIQLNNVLSFGDYVFSGATINHIYLNNMIVPTIFKNTFDGLQSVIIRDNMFSSFLKNPLFGRISKLLVRNTNISILSGKFLVNFTTSDGNLLSYIGDAKEIIIPPNITNIAAFALAYIPSLENIVFHNKIVKIEEYAFYLDYNLTHIYLPDSITYIGDYALYNTSVSILYLPKSLTQIGKIIFNEGIIILGDIFTGVQEFVINPDKIYVSTLFYDDYLLLYPELEDLFEIYYPEYLSDEIPNPFFGMLAANGILESYFLNLNTILISSSEITSIGDYAFKGAYNLQSVTLFDNIQSIGVGAFENCIYLANISIFNNDSIEISTKAFKNCSLLNIVYFQNLTISSIGSLAFFGCSKLLRIQLNINIKDSIILEDDWNLIGYDYSGDPIYATVEWVEPEVLDY
ncbi:MAG: leucine-rich repeat protein [Christensenellaceae bacterium]|jgi:hypothetical protein|nr:leucine-rich repeat protein [Christensenellaceae bacterium]